MPQGFGKIFFVVFISAVFWVGAGKADAISLVPALVEVEADAGESLIQKITLFNETSQTITVYPKVENFKTQADTQAPEFLGDEDPLGAARWILAPVENISLEPGKRTDVLIKIKISDAAEPGGHYAALLWSEKLPEDVGIGTASRIATLFLFKIKGEVREDAKIISFQKEYPNQPINFILRLQNNGNIHLKPGGTIDIKNWRGKTVAELPINLKGQSILPQSQRNFTSSWAVSNFLPGWYSVEAGIIYGVSSKTLSARMNFWYWPERFGNKILGLVLILIFVVVIFKMARRRAVHLFVILFLLSQFLILPVLASTTSTSGATTVSATVFNSPGGAGGGGDEQPIDKIAPAQATGLSAGSSTQSSITLHWTAPGDDGNSGTASSYDIRYSLSNITDANWSGATSIPNAPSPQIAGKTESVVAAGLSPSTTYYFALKTADEASNWSRLSNIVSATTLPQTFDTTAPLIDSIAIKPGVDSAEISWHTNEASDSQVAYGLTTQLGDLSVNTNFFTSHKVVLSGLAPSTVYYVKVISTDASGNQGVGLFYGVSQIGAFKTQTDKTPPANVRNFHAAAGDKKVTLSWIGPPDSDFDSVFIVRNSGHFPSDTADGFAFPAIKGNPNQFGSLIDTHGLKNGLIYYYTAFAGDKYGNYASGAIAQATPQASEKLPIVPKPPAPKPDRTLPPSEESGEESALGGPGTQDAGGGSGAEGLQLNDFNFIAAKGQIIISASSQFGILAGADMGVNLSNSKTPKEIESIVLSVADSAYLFSFSEQKKMWQTGFTAPAAVGAYPAALTIKFFDQTSGVLNWNLQALPYGQVYEKKDGQKYPLSGAAVSLYYQNQLWPAFSFYQNNPQTTGADGSFGFIVPPGKYLLKIEKAGYSTEEIDVSADGVAVNNALELLYLPPKIKDVINPEATLAENISNIAQNLGEQSLFISKKVLKEINSGARRALENAKEIANNPEAQKIAEKVAAPVVASAAAASTAAVVGWAQLLGYLRFLFTQPALLVKRRRRHGWGVVYNSLTKLPLDLVIVRLVDAVSGKIIQTRVTDSNGRYVFFPSVGSYRLETGANQFKFPTSFLSSLKDDGAFLDLYHGELVDVKEAGATITANIPLDPAGAEPPVWRVMGRLIWRRMQHLFSILSLLIAVGFAIWVPGILTVGLLAAQVVFYGLFLRLAVPRKPKSWGIIYDEKTRMPLAKAVARIFDMQYNKLLETQVTDKTGKYSFLVGRNKYYVSYEKDGYEKKQSEAIDLQNNSEPVASVGVDADLKPASNNANRTDSTNATNNNVSNNDNPAVDKPIKDIS